MNKKIKIALVTLIIVLISMISFGGIYQKSLNSYQNIIKDYLLARNLKGSRVVELKVTKAENEETTEQVEEEETQEETTIDNKTEGENVEQEENSVTMENLKTVKKVLESRLKDLGSQDYVIEQNQEDGTTTIYLTEDDLADNITGYLTQIGDFTIVDSEDTSNVLMTNEDIKKAKVGYSQTTSGTTVYLSIEFNKEGREKLKNISNTYIKTTDEQGNETEKKIILRIDDTDVLTTSFDETIETGILSMSIGSASTSSSNLQEYILQASGMATLLNDGKLPITYTIEKNEYVSLDNANQMMQITSLVVAIIIIAIIVILSIKYKANGLKVGITMIGTIAIFLLLIRYTNVYLAMESVVAVAILILVMTILNVLILKNKKENTAKNAVLKAYQKTWKLTVPVLVLSVILSFIPWVPVASIGMLLLWGLISIAFSSFTLTLPILSDD